MIALKFPELLFLIGVVCAAKSNVYVGLHIATDESFRVCSPYKGEALKDYLRAFAGAVGLRFQELLSPPVKIVFLGSSELTGEQEAKVIGKNKDASGNAVNGASAVIDIMDITVADEKYPGTNKLFYVLTRLNITEGKTIPADKVKVPIPDPKSSAESKSSEDYDDTSSEIQERSVSSKKPYPNVGGLTQYGTICSVWGAGAIGQDDGSSFSGVESAAQQVATVLGPVYNGSIVRRICGHYDSENAEEFHGAECSNIAIKSELEDPECLEEDIQEENSTVKTPSDFFTIYSQWTPCSVSYMGSRQCATMNEKAPENCKIKCCYDQDQWNANLNPISAPEGTDCGLSQMCMNGTCGIKKQQIDNPVSVAC